MGVFGAFFGRRGDAGFKAPLFGGEQRRCRFQRSLVGGEQWCCWFQRRHVVSPCARKSSPCVLIVAQNWCFRACWASFFAEMPLEGRCWASFFAPIGPAPRSCRRRGARGWLRWGFCSIRSWLAACRTSSDAISPVWWRPGRAATRRVNVRGHLSVQAPWLGPAARP